MIVETYQSPVVKKILEEGKVYKALPSVNQNLNKAYKCLIQMLGLSCECPIFGVLRGYRQCTNGAGASSVKFTLDVPDDQVHLTEYDDWAQFLHNIKYISPVNYRSVNPIYLESMPQKELDAIIESLTTPRPPKKYKIPQVVLEKIDPAWIVQENAVLTNNQSESLVEKVKNLFSK